MTMMTMMAMMAMTEVVEVVAVAVGLIIIDGEIGEVGGQVEEVRRPVVIEVPTTTVKVMADLGVVVVMVVVIVAAVLGRVVLGQQRERPPQLELQKPTREKVALIRKNRVIALLIVPLKRHVIHILTYPTLAIHVSAEQEKPTCRCGEEVVERTVSKEGPNKSVFPLFLCGESSAHRGTHSL